MSKYSEEKFNALIEEGNALFATAVLMHGDGKKLIRDGCILLNEGSDLCSESLRLRMEGKALHDKALAKRAKWLRFHLEK